MEPSSNRSATSRVFIILLPQTFPWDIDQVLYVI